MPSLAAANTLSDASPRFSRGVAKGYAVTARDASDVATVQAGALAVAFDELDDFFEHAPIPFHCVGPDGTILRANASELSFLGYQRDDYVGHNVAEFHVDKGAADEIMRRLGNGDVLHSYQARLLAKDGSTKDVLIDSSALFRNGEFIHSRCFTRDNTAQSEIDSRRRLAEFDADLGRILAEVATCDEMLQACAAAIVTHLGGAVARIWTLNDDEDVLELRASAGRTTDVGGEQARIPVGSLRIGRIAAARAAHITHAVVDDPSICDPEWARHEGVVAFVGHPLVLGERLLGVMALFGRAPLDQITLAALASGARLVALGIDRLRADSELHLAHDRLSAIFDASPGGIFSMDPDLRVTQWSAGAERITGWTADEVLGERPRQVPDEEWPAFEALAARARSGERVRGVETQRTHKNGTLIYVSVSLAAINRSDGAPYGYVAIIDDVTVRKLAEAARLYMEDMLRRVAAASLDMNASLSIDEVLSRVTTNVQEILDAQQAMTIAVFDGNWADATVSVALSDRYAEWRDRVVIADGHGLQRAVCEENRAVRLSRAELAAHPAWGALAEGTDARPALRGVLAAPLIALDGSNLGLVQLSDKCVGEFTAIDELILLQMARLAAISIENAHLYEEQGRTAERLARANGVMDEFLGLVSHELRTPITTIYGNARVLRQHGAALDEADRATAMQDIEVEADRLQRIIENLLILARFDATQAIETEPVKLESSIRSVSDAYMRSHPTRSIDIEIGDGVIYADAQPTYLELVLGNLVSNADKYSTSDATIQVKAWRDEDNVRVAVLDRGSGVIPDEVAELFSPFYRAGRTMSVAPGMGIGLAVCKRIMEAQGGEIWAKPREGGGAEFGFSLRVASDHLEAGRGGADGLAAGGATHG